MGATEEMQLSRQFALCCLDVLRRHVTGTTTGKEIGPHAALLLLEESLQHMNLISDKDFSADWDPVVERIEVALRCHKARTVEHGK